MEAHVLICPECLVECPRHCSATFPRRAQEHHDAECPLLPADCQYSSIGCTVKLPRHELERHYEAAKGEHLQLALSSLSLVQVHAFCCLYMYSILFVVVPRLAEYAVEYSKGNAAAAQSAGGGEQRAESNVGQSALECSSRSSSCSD